MSDTILSDPSDPKLHHYIVTLKNFDDLEQFYTDMEDPSNNNFTPDRSVECMDRREISRNTQYMLSDQEAKKLESDPRVESVMLHPEILGISDSLFWAEQDTSVLNFDKTATTSPSAACNWGLLRCTEPSNQTINGRKWGEGGVSTIATQLQLAPTGKNVDVVLVDFGVPDPAHPEYAVNADGSGGSRLHYVNWTSRIGINYPSVPTAGITTDTWHSWHVAGTAAGNRQGWARDANIYVASLGVSSNVFDYVREWHLAKPVNPQTGRTNPTVVNMSIGSSIAYSAPGTNTAGWNRTNLSRVYFRGRFYYPPFTDQQLIGFGMLPGKPWPVISSSWVADIQDAFSDGIIVVAAAGNESWRLDSPNGLDWNNFATYYGYDFYISRGSTPGRIGTMDSAQPICVAALNSDANETRAYFTNYGPGVDIFAPGTNINSSVPRVRGTADIRNSDYGLAYSQGTSMATPQITGIIACMLEDNPSWNQIQARSWIVENGKNNLMGELTTMGTYYQLSGSPNKIAYFPNTFSQQVILPKVSLQVLPASVMENSNSPITFTFTIDADITSPLTIGFIITGTAQFGLDYTTTSFFGNIGSIEIPVGHRQGTIVVYPIADNLIEGNETITLSVASGNTYTISNLSSATATIIDYVVVKPSVSISCTPPNVLESSRTGITWRITRTPANSQPLLVHLNVAGTATFGSDYISNELANVGTNTINIPAGQTSYTITCRPVADIINEPTETIVIALQPNDAYNISNASATGSITNVYVPPPAVKITVSPNTMIEGVTRPIVFSIGRTGQNTLPLTVNYTVSGTAKAGSDYTGITGPRGNITIPVGQNFVQIPVNVIDDTIKEPTESIIVSLSSSPEYIVGSPGYASAFIRDND